MARTINTLRNLKCLIVHTENSVLIALGRMVHRSVNILMQRIKIYSTTGRAFPFVNVIIAFQFLLINKQYMYWAETEIGLLREYGMFIHCSTGKQTSITKIWEYQLTFATIQRPLRSHCSLSLTSNFLKHRRSAGSISPLCAIVSKVPKFLSCESSWFHRMWKAYKK